MDIGSFDVRRAITLPPLIVELHLMVGEHAHLFSVAWSCVLVIAMVAFGAFTRLGTDELVPPSKGQNAALSRLLGFASFAVSCACLFFVLFNLLGGLENDPSNGWIYAFSIPWTGYGAVALLAIAWRQFDSEGYPETLSVTKDVVLGILDVWSKATFSFFVASKAFGNNSIFFGL